ncbi:hypothetical protein [Actinophytocola sp. NPDC049390]|uniref:hypothetical protein n=1 Tax=Actinophytocola sp. NPDC049390 TaxID=3363894 RepID=UPI00378D02EA
MADKRTFSQPGTARALVLLASALALAGAVLVFLLVLVFGEALVGRLTGTVLAATAVFAGFVLVSAIVANLLAIRSTSLRGIVGVGCGTLLAGFVVGLGACLLLISRAA